MSTRQVGVVAALARFPVKSMLGEEPAELEIDARGVRHDRSWAAYTDDGGIASGKTTRRFRRVEGMLAWRARVDGARPVVEGPSGERAEAGTPTADALLSRSLGRTLRLQPEAAIPHHDECGIHLVTTAALRALAEVVGDEVDVRRFRANVVVDCDDDGFPEDAWAGRELVVGSALLRVGEPMPRCVMVDMAQGELPPDGRVLRALGPRGAMLGVQAAVASGGVVRVGDAVALRE